MKLKGIERQIEQRISNFNKKSYSQSNFGDKRKKCLCSSYYMSNNCKNDYQASFRVQEKKNFYIITSENIITKDMTIKGFKRRLVYTIRKKDLNHV